MYVITCSVAIIIYPKILLWLVAMVLIAMGVGMLMMATLMRGFAKYIRQGSV